MLFSPYEYDKSLLRKYDVILGENYPHPIIDYVESRKKALATYKNFLIQIKFVANYAFF